MNAIVLTRPGQVNLVEQPPPEARPGEALLQVRQVGLCGSDVTSYIGGNPLVRYPRVPGHEVCAEILAVEANEQGLRVGDLVCVEPLLSCGRCGACRRGRYNCCMNLRVLGVHVDGGLRERFTHPTNRLHKAGPPLSADRLALCEPLSIGVHVNRRGDVQAGQQVVILGAGAIGICALVVARTRTPHVLVADKLAERLERASAFGAEVTVNVTRTDVEQAVMDWTKGAGADVVLEAVGTPETLELTLDLVAYGGRIAVLGLCKAPVTFYRSSLFVEKEVDFVGSRNSREAFPEVLELVESGRIDLTPLITHRFSLARTAEAFELMVHHPEQVGKCIVQVTG